MRIHTSKIKAIVAFMLVLCFSIAVLFPVASTLALANHTHMCCDGEHKDAYADARECCLICANHYRVKIPNPILCGRAANNLSAALEPPLLHLLTGFSFLDIAFSTSTALKVRLNN